MNQFNGIGRLVREADIKETKAGKKFARFTIAINRFNDETDFVDCIVFNERVVGVVEKYTNKGSQIGISGSLNINTSEKDGHKFKHPQINVQAVDLLDNKNSNNSQDKQSDNPFAKGTDDLQDELPF
ncbi:MAG TPA: single-stranded DNA-binding protein [Mammaliicoccus lentus]|nr:single-stranded DNA-binding protein [Mammaliicoccus lentus]HJF23225.1 single-stranded DNA-binding protein [Mammaliicoccus lentus]